MKAGALFALVLAGTFATAQDGFYCGTTMGPLSDTKIEANFFTTDRKGTIVTFTTSDRADFYELLRRAGAIVDWEYEVDWSPNYRLKVFVTRDEGRPWLLEQEMDLRRLIIRLNMTYKITGGRYELVFRGAKSKDVPPQISAANGRMEYEAWDVPSLLVLATLAESQKALYRVDGVKSETIDVTFVGAGLNDAFYALEANLDWNIKRGPRGLIVRRSNKPGR